MLFRSMEKSGLTPQRVIQSINELFEDAVITTDVGQNQLWTTQFLDIDENKQMLTSGGLGNADISELFRISKVFGITVMDYDGSTVLLECMQTENKNDDLITLLKRKFVNRIEVTRGGSVAVESVSISER